jgi:hypothetical protein
LEAIPRGRKYRNRFLTSIPREKKTVKKPDRRKYSVKSLDKQDHEEIQQRIAAVRQLKIKYAYKIPFEEMEAIEPLRTRKNTPRTWRSSRLRRSGE